MAVVLLAVAYVLGGWRPTVTTLVCEAIIFGTGLWNDTMITLAMTLVATLLVMVIAIVLGVAMGRSRKADMAIRPFLDAFQVIPPFVYLVPALALFLPSRFTAIVAAVAYAVPDRDQAGGRRHPGRRRRRRSRRPGPAASRAGR